MKKLKLLTKILIPFILIPNAIFALDYGDLKSSTLTAKAWESLSIGNWENVEAYTQKCIDLYSKEALKQQAQLNNLPAQSLAFSYWALNDVGTCYFIRAKTFLEKGDSIQTQKICEMVQTDLSYSQCFDPSQNIFWSIASACKDLQTKIDQNIDFEDYTSETLTHKAWESLGREELYKTEIYAKKCIQLYEKTAIEQQEKLSTYAPKETAFNNWALNDIGTCYFILGEAYSKLNKWEDALKAYRTLINDFPYSQCFDPSYNGFWKPAVAARGKINKIQAEQNL